MRSSFAAALRLASVTALLLSTASARGGAEDFGPAPDRLGVVATAPGTPKGSIFADFEANEHIALFSSIPTQISPPMSSYRESYCRDSGETDGHRRGKTGFV